MPIRKTGSLPENIDRQVNEIIRAYREVEEKVNRLQNTLDSQIRSNVESIRQHTLNKSNPHFVTAQQIRALPLEFILDSSAVYFPFYQSLVSTRGIEPDGLQGATKTEYGLVSGNNLCATLLPEGGVAVTEGTTNLLHGKLDYDTSPPEPVPGHPDALVYYNYFTVDVTMQIDSQTPAHSVQAWVYMAEDWDYEAWEFRFLLNDEIVGKISADLSKKGQWQHVKGTFVGSADQVQLRSAGSGTSQRRWIALAQIEPKPFVTPYTEDTRAVGRLSYHDLAKHFNQREFTFACWWRPYLELADDFARIFQADSVNSSGRRINLRRVNATQDLDLILPNAEGSNDQIFTFTPSTYAAYEWQFVAVVVDVANMTARIHLNDEYEEFTLPETPAMLDLKRFHLGCIGTTSLLLNGELKNVLLRPYAVSPETISTWYSLDVPFIDPFILPSQGVTQTPQGVTQTTDDITIIETLESTDDDITIIETSENTEVDINHNRTHD